MTPADHIPSKRQAAKSLIATIVFFGGLVWLAGYQYDHPPIPQTEQQKIEEQQEYDMMASFCRLHGINPRKSPWTCAKAYNDFLDSW
jgi:hypothetical protein